MAEFTKNLNIEKPSGNENFRREVINSNMDKLDNKFGIEVGEGHIHDGTKGQGKKISFNNLADIPATMPPKAHKAGHAVGGVDALSPADIGAASQAEFNAHKSDYAAQINGSTTIINIVNNGNFANGTIGWLTDNGSIAVVNNVATQTAAQVAAYGNLYRNLGTRIVGHKYYGKITARVTNSACKRFHFVWGDDFANFNNPIQNQWYTLSGVMTSTGISANGGIEHYYADTVTANGKVMEVKEVLVIDLTVAYGAGTEPTVAQMDVLINTYFDGWFDGTRVTGLRKDVNRHMTDVTKHAANWQVWTPTLTWWGNTPTGITTTARYCTIGKTVFYAIIIDATNGNGTTGVQVSLPVAFKNNGLFPPQPSYQYVGNTPYNPQGIIGSIGALTYIAFTTATSGQSLGLRTCGCYEIS